MIYPPLKDMVNADIYFYNDGNELIGSGGERRRKAVLSLSEADMARAASHEAAMFKLSSRLGYTYPYEAQARGRVKYTVSELNRRDGEVYGRPDIHEFNPDGAVKIDAAKAGTQCIL